MDVFIEEKKNDFLVTACEPTNFVDLEPENSEKTYDFDENDAFSTILFTNESESMDPNSLVDFITQPIWSNSYEDTDGNLLNNVEIENSSQTDDGNSQNVTEEEPDLNNMIESPKDDFRTNNDFSGDAESSNFSLILSQSVQVSRPFPNPIQLVTPLEQTYRPRYKSDYFPSSGEPRRPRYVADELGNHCVTLKIPKIVGLKNSEFCVRVALITTHIEKQGSFYSPYKFQRSNSDISILDENPTYYPVPTNDSSQIKLQLVLIKSKLDQLNQVQPLLRFPSLKPASTHKILKPKALIQQYQLEKSRIAFTLCKKENGKYLPFEETTIISGVITEVPLKMTPKNIKMVEREDSKNSSNAEKTVTCPNCSHCFHYEKTETVEKINNNKRKGNENANELTMKPKRIKKNK